MRCGWPLGLWLLLAAPPAALAAEPAPAGDALVAQHCAACHQLDGIGKADPYPNLAAQKRGYLAKQLRDFRSGRRRHPLMNAVARNLSDEQIAAVAAYYAALPAR